VIRAVLFDLDGTLIDTWDLYVEAYLRTLEPHLGRRLVLSELIALRPTSELRFFGRAIPGCDLPEICRQFLGHYRALHLTHFAGPYPGVCEMLDQLRTRGFRLGVVTGKGRAAWDITATQVNLGEFELVVTDEEVAAPKPDPEGLIKALDRLGTQAKEVIYVGDSRVDAEAAQRAGIPFAAALWPKSLEDLETFRSQVRALGAWTELALPGSLVALLEQDNR
jgi:HAD superfamily hydrolase (TIGR01509 family)